MEKRAKEHKTLKAGEEAHDDQDSEGLDDDEELDEEAKQRLIE